MKTNVIRGSIFGVIAVIIVYTLLAVVLTIFDPLNNMRVIAVLANFYLSWYFFICLIVGAVLGALLGNGMKSKNK